MHEGKNGPWMVRVVTLLAVFPVSIYFRRQLLSHSYAYSLE